MSIRHPKEDAPLRQPKSTKKVTDHRNPETNAENATEAMIALRISFGVATRRDLVKVFHASLGTVGIWVTKGLKAFRPGTREELFLVKDVQDFLHRRESFRGAAKKSKRPKK